MKDVTIENNWTFELGVGDGIDVPIYVGIGIIQSLTPKVCCIL